MPYYPMGVQSAMTGVISEAVPSYNPGASSSIATVYSSMMPPPQSYSQLLDPSSSSTRYTRPEDTPSSSTRHIHQSSLGGSTTTSSPILSTALHSPSLTRHRGLTGDITSSSAIRNSPLSLASITSPYHPQHQQHQQIQSQPKNCHAQTLILGERLRQGSDGLVIFQVRCHRRRYWLIVPYRPRGLLRLLHLWLLVLQPHFIFNKQDHPVVCQLVIPVHLLHAVRIEND